MVLLSLLLALPAVMFWLWLVILPAGVAIVCPGECRCEAGGYYVVCDETSLTAVPLIQLPDVRGICLYKNKIRLFKNDSFVSLIELEILNVVSCGLRTIELGAFNGLTKLTGLGIWGNEICEIKPGTFENMISLKLLDIGNNRLVKLHSGVFSGLLKLTYINLGINKLQHLHPDTFSALPTLEGLDLSFNPGLHIPTDCNFINSHSLLLLGITDCNVSSVSVETFANVSAMEMLDLSYNNLRTLDINILRALPKLSLLYLYGNSLQCDCQLKEVWQCCEDRNIWKLDLICDTPREVEGMWWGVLEKGKCLDGNITYYGDYNITHYSYTDNDRNIRNDSLYDNEILNLYKLPAFAVPLIFGITSNVIILIIIISNKDMRTVSNLYIINLAISDIIFVTVNFFELYTNSTPFNRKDNEFVCTFLPFCIRLPVCLSAYSLAVFSFQQYRVTANPFHLRVSSQATWRVTVAAICGVWIVSASFAVPSVLSNYVFQIIYGRSSTTYYQHVVIFELLVSCVLPLCVIAFSHITTARHLVESSRSVSEGTQNPQLNTRRNTGKIVVGLVLVFLISYVPYNVFWTHFICREDFLLLKFSGFLDNSKKKNSKHVSNFKMFPFN